MIVTKCFSVFLAVIFGIRTILISVERNPDVKRCLLNAVATFFLVVCGFFATNSPRIFVILALSATFVARMLLKQRRVFPQSNPPSAQIASFLDQIILSMRGGLSFDGAFREISRFEGKNFLMTKDQSEFAELKRVLSYCERHPSQSFKVLSGFRESFQKRSRLKNKFAAAALQAKAQAAISVALYALIVIFEWFSVPEFRVFLRAPSGKFVFFLSALLVGAGTLVIFRLGRPPELEL